MKIIKPVVYTLCLFSAALFLLACKNSPSTTLAFAKKSVELHSEISEKHSQESFVQVKGGQFFLEGKPYAYVGTNMWYAAYLGSPNTEYGDRFRLVRELQFLQEQGITNLRILGASEKSPMRDAMRPAISEKGEVINEDILVGLDFALAEMGKRNLKAVIFLNNFWEWSGGMATYLYWENGGEIVDMSDPNKPWPAFALFSAQFYSNPKAVALFNQYVRSLLSRRNSITGILYKDDPTIMAWQLANEPRPGDGDASKKNLPVYYSWIKNTTALIKSLAPKQLVSVGSEGTMGCLVLDECFIHAHKDTGVDYATFHMWLKNWGWFDANNPEQTFPQASKKAEDYIDHHIALAQRLKMPLVLEEFGLERDGGAFSPESSTYYRDQYFAAVFARVEQSVGEGGPLTGSNFWAWGGFGDALHGDAVWRKGDKSFVGDPPQEPQGLNSVFVTDNSTLELIRKHAQKITR